MIRNNPEEKFQRQVATYLSAILSPPTIWTAFPAGGGGRPRGGKLKAMGLKAGWPDLLILHPAPQHTVVVGIELKARGGVQSIMQRFVQAGFERAGATYRLCWSLADVERALRAADIPVRGRIT